ncbi:CoA transferase [Nonomuraea sp. NPDC048916]|uniref:CaiB/BaiF CoA transferase family protein n=1 Tax=Nonomuraea sp. NPDC048916 TaxID=3154232 RepID=UPI0033E6A85C
MSMEDAAPLAGITVLEVGGFIAAPFATLQLADLGARIVKVENPTGGEPVRATGPFVAGESAPFARFNRNKESVALDLKSSGGRDAFLRLAATADVLVENLRPGAMAALGLGYDDVRNVNPRIIYASASGWGQSGPLAAQPGLDIMAQARGGLMSITGDPDGDPAKTGVPICDLVCALYVALAVTAALREQAHSGQGQHIDVSLLESGVSLAVWEAAKYFTTGEVGGRLGSAHQSMAPYQAIRCADGYVTVGAVTPKTWKAFCTALDLESLLEDTRYADSFSRHAHRDELIASIEAATTARSTAELVDALEVAGVPCAPIADYSDVFTSAHLGERDFFWDSSHPTIGTVRQIGSPMRFSRTPVRRGPAGPVLGADTQTVLMSAGFTSDEVKALVEAGAAAEAVLTDVPGHGGHEAAGPTRPRDHTAPVD